MPSYLGYFGLAKPRDQYNTLDRISSIAMISGWPLRQAMMNAVSPSALKISFLASSSPYDMLLLGSIPFTTAAYLQLFQAANADPAPGEPDFDQSRWKSCN